MLTPSEPVPPHGARTLVVTAQRFSGDSNGTVVLAADWALGSPHPGKTPAVHHVHIVEPAGSTAGGPVSAAMSKALGALADDVVRQVG